MKAPGRGAARSREPQARRRDRSASSLFDKMLLGVASAQAAEPALDIEGVHFFPFGRLAATARRADELYLGKVI